MERFKEDLMRSIYQDATKPITDLLLKVFRNTEEIRSGKGIPYHPSHAETYRPPSAIISENGTDF